MIRDILSSVNPTSAISGSFQRALIVPESVSRIRAFASGLPKFAAPRIKQKKKVFSRISSEDDFEEYQAGLYDRLDTMNDLLMELIGRTPISPTESLAPTPSRRNNNLERARSNMFNPAWLLAFAVPTLLASGFTEYPWKYLIQPILNALTGAVSRITGFFRGIFRRLAGLWRGIKSWFRNLTGWFRNIGRTVSRVWNRVVAAARRLLGRVGTLVERIVIEPLRRLAATAGNAARGIGNRVGRMGRALANSPVGRFLGRLVRGSTRALPLMARMLTPIIEFMEANSEIRELEARLNNGEITEREYREQSTRAYVQALADSVAIGGGALVGSILGAALGPIGIVAGGALGGMAGEWVSHQFAKPLIDNMQLVATLDPRQIDALADQVLEFATNTLPESFDRLVSMFSAEDDGSTPRGRGRPAVLSSPEPSPQQHATRQRNIGSTPTAAQVATPSPRGVAQQSSVTVIAVDRRRSTTNNLVHQSQPHRPINNGPAMNPAASNG